MTARKPDRDAGEIADVTIESIGARGDGIAHRNGAPVFVPFSVPGDRLRVRLGAAREQGHGGEIVEILDKGNERAEPACRHFGVCGGCALQHMADAAYAEWKCALVRCLFYDPFSPFYARRPQVFEQRLCDQLYRSTDP